ncbi:RNA degradosome polyphosphate kinase [Odoribacter laneus]|uniref:RNA degradosome polyphosphate kinase n=2 Tax=Odoribacter laneus TaxID=626933 RepID=UPI000337B195|nr:RNA degradosome polyphosphate kinase [Odoribacter laneus]CCZ80946.1 polyphosphate kinase [Odoribacter laneus CAG:561]
MKKNGKYDTKTYIERDISWMYFNQRILLEAEKTSVPLLERLNFLGIYSNNLDEFFRVRVATLNRIIEYKGKAIQQEKAITINTFKTINRLNICYSTEFEDTFHIIDESLKQNNIWLLNEKELNPEQKNFICHLYHNRLNGSTTPLFISTFQQLDEQPDDAIYLAVLLNSKKNPASARTKITYAFIELPVKEYGRFLRLPDADGKTCLIFLDDAVRFCLPFIFEGTPFCGFEAYTFKFTKDAEMELDTDLRNSVMQKIAKGVKSRKKGEPIRLVYDACMPANMLKHIARMLNIDKWDTQVAGGRYHNMKDLMKFPDCNRRDLKYKPLLPIFKPEFTSSDSLLEIIRQKDRFLHYPYHSFSSFLRVLREAAISQDVTTIKMTLYRLAKDSKVVQTLISAARNGKKVTVVIELLARFDEASNISWSKQMQDAGIRVIFGVEGLKVHSKLLFIGSKKGDIACISTGNFHEGNAAQYTDVTLFTDRKKLVQEVNAVFTFIEKPYVPVHFRELLVSPNDMRKQLIQRINREIKNAKTGKTAYILGKVNHITDKIIIEKLYEASTAGVKIDLLVRGNCSVVTGLAGISENIRINGIIDRYLEHSRIFIFANGGRETYILGSADWMPRNFDNRIEVMTPVYDKNIQAELKRIVEYGLRDTYQGRIVDGSGRNLPWILSSGEPLRSQTALYEYYSEQAGPQNKQCQF